MFDGTRRVYINPSATGYSGQSGRVWVYDDEPSAISLTAVNPLGSLIYEGNASGTLEQPGEVDRFSLSLDPGQTISVAAMSLSDVQTKIQVFSPSDALLGETQTTNQRTSIALQNVPATTSGTYIIEISGLDDTTGDYEFDVLLNASIEAEHHGGVDNFNTAESIDSSFISLGLGTAERGAVVGRADSLYYVNENFESGSLSDDWTTTSSDQNGRIQVTNANGAATGSYALWMDTIQTNPTVLNEAVLIANLNGLSNATLSFWHTEYADSPKHAANFVHRQQKR